MLDEVKLGKKVCNKINTPEPDQLVLIKRYVVFLISKTDVTLYDVT